MNTYKAMQIVGIFGGSLSACGAFLIWFTARKRIGAIKRKRERPERSTAKPLKEDALSGREGKKAAVCRTWEERETEWLDEGRNPKR